MWWKVCNSYYTATIISDQIITGLLLRQEWGPNEKLILLIFLLNYFSYTWTRTILTLMIEEIFWSSFNEIFNGIDILNINFFTKLYRLIAQHTRILYWKTENPSKIKILFINSTYSLQLQVTSFRQSFENKTYEEISWRTTFYCAVFFFFVVFTLFCPPTFPLS